MRRTLHLADTWAPAMVWAMVLTYVGLFTWLSLTRHWAFATDAYDLGNVNQALWNTVHGRPLYFTNWRGVELTLASDSRLAMHVEPIYFLIAPIYWLFQRPETPLVLQTVILALGAWPVYWLARDSLGSQAAGVAFAAVYLLFPGLQAANLWEFHAVALAAPLLLFAFYFGWKGRWGLCWLFAILAMATKEEVPLTVLLMGLYFAFTGLRQADRVPIPTATGNWRAALRLPQVRHGLALSLVGMIWFVIAVFVIIPAYEGGGSPYLSYYEALLEPSGTAQPSSVPESLPATLLSRRNIEYLIDLYTPVAFLSLLNPLALLLSAPDLAINLLSDHEPMHFVEKYHYVAPLLPGVMISAVLGAGWLARRLAGRTGWRAPAIALALSAVVLLASGWYHYYHGYTPLARAFEPYQVTSHHELGMRIARQIPQDAAVSAQRNLNPHVSGRQTLYRFPWVDDADYVFLDVSTLLNRGFIYGIVDELLAGDEFGLVHAEDGYLLLQRGAADQDNLEGDLLSFAHVGEERVRQAEYPASVQFGDRLELVGFDMAYGRHTEMPQTPLRFQLYWQVDQPIEEDYQVGLFLLDDIGQVIGSLNLDQEPGLGHWYPISQWDPDQFIQVSMANMPWWTEQLNAYGVAVGVFQGDDPWDLGSRLRPNVQGSPQRTPYADHGTLVELMRFETDAGGMPVPRPFSSPPGLPTNAVAQEADWNAGIQLAGYALSSPRVSPGEPLDVTLYWRAQQPIPENYTVFIHVVDDTGRLVAQHDAEPGLGGYPTSSWPPDELIVDRHPLQIGADVPREAYKLLVGLYRLEDGQRVPLAGGGDSLRLSTEITVR